MTALTNALIDVMHERHRQQAALGWTPEHDDQYTSGELVHAASAYATAAARPSAFRDGGLPPDWPWDRAYWRPADPRRDLVRAAALLLAEIERLDRASPPEPRPVVDWADAT